MTLGLSLPSLLGSSQLPTSLGPIGELVITNKLLAPDGFSRNTVVANGQYPGPLVKGYKGETFMINVVDKLSDTSMDTVTSIHWHGMFQHNSPDADGVAFISQCPIIPSHSYLYHFRVPDQAGTYWYHSHYRAQYCDGLRGPMVIYDPFDPQKSLYDVDNEDTIITLSDWYHYLSTEYAPFVPAPNSTLINGKGRYPGGPQTDLAVVNVIKGLRYRMRLISLACDPHWMFSIDKHDMTIIEVDGVNHKPLIVDSIQIFAGQRYSFVLHANQPVDNYWIRALSDSTVNNDDDVSSTVGLNSAILRYRGAKLQDPTSSQSSTNALVEAKLVPLKNHAAPGLPHPGGADIVIDLAVTLNFTSLLFEVNGVSFEPPSIPVLLQILSGSMSATSMLPTGSVIELERNKVVEIVMPGEALAGPHPIHLHGHTFYVVRSAGQTEYNFDNPPQRDVVSIGGADDRVTIRFVTDNPGPWFMHCHIDWHLELGLAVVMAEASPQVDVEDRPVPYAWKQLCPAYEKYMSSMENAVRPTSSVPKYSAQQLKHGLHRSKHHKHRSPGRL